MENKLYYYRLPNGVCTCVNFETKGLTEITKAEYDDYVTICDLKKRLATYDYIGVKIATGVATIAEYADEIAIMEDLRRQIRELEK